MTPADAAHYVAEAQALQAWFNDPGGIYVELILSFPDGLGILSVEGEEQFHFANREEFDEGIRETRREFASEA